MMGIKARAFAPVDHLTLEDLVPRDHFYRQLERVLDLSFVRELVAPYYAAGGRPSIDPVVFFKLELVMFFEGIRSERHLMRLVADRLSARWYCGYDLHESLPDHSSLTRIRERYGLEVFRRFFAEIVERCQAAGLVWGTEFYIDATKMVANAAVDSIAPRFAVAARAHLDDLFALDEGAVGPPPPPLSVELPDPHPIGPSTEAAPELTTANAARHDWIAQGGQQDRPGRPTGSPAGRATLCPYSRLRHQHDRPRRHPPALPRRGAAGLPGALPRGWRQSAHHPGGVGDTGGGARGASGARPALAGALPLAAVAAPGHRRQVLRHAGGDPRHRGAGPPCLRDAAGPRPCHHDHATPYFGKGAFAYDPVTDAYTCPGGATLPYIRPSRPQQLLYYQAEAATCNACALKARCTRSDHGRMLSRHYDEEFRDRVRAYRDTDAYHKARHKRSVWVEPLFAEAKDWHGLRRCRLRRLWRVNVQVLWTASGQNLKRLLAGRGWGRRPFPAASGLHPDRLPASLAAC